jgi:hypothetical protein
MSSQSFFKFAFINKCISEGKDPSEEARKELVEIDKQLAVADGLKLRRLKLIEVLTHLGDETYLRGRSSSVISTEDVNDEELNLDKYKEIVVSIIKQNNCEPMTIRELISATGLYDKDALIIRSVKDLGDKDIVKRDSEGRVCPGSEWK